MGLTLYYHPLASFCHKVLIPLYENGTPFERVIVDFGDPRSAAAFRAVWPIAKMPVLVDSGRGATVAESTVVIDYLDSFHAGPVRFTPADPDLAWRVRFWDRFFDQYVHEPMQRIVGDALRPADKRDGFGVEQARAQIRKSYAYFESRMTEREWIAGHAFTLADCSAAPALFYANVVEPIGPDHPAVRAYFGRLMEWPSVARTYREAEPFFGYFPLDPKPGLPAA
ncbi:MAG: glutathione S-transferase family protein [Rhizobiaceae bacterium]|nr:glutathione S-transferase family protein [Rhizobiaceae bacterium]